MLLNFIKLRKLWIIISQALGCIICIYFILNADRYQVSFKLLTWLMPSIVEKLNNGLSWIGTYILVIPLSIIILSWLIPESISLRIASTFFGVFSTITMIISGAFKNTLSEIYDMRVLLITKILTVEQKREIFKQEYLRVMENEYNNTIKLYNALKEALLQKYFEIYDVELIKFKEKAEVELYVNKIIQKVVETFNTLEQNHSSITINSYTHIVLWLIAAGVGIFLIATIFRYLTESNLLPLANYVKDSSTLGARTQMSMENFMILMKEYLPIILKDEQIAAQIQTLMVGDLISGATKKGFENVSSHLAQQQKSIDVLATKVLELIKWKSELTGKK